MGVGKDKSDKTRRAKAIQSQGLDFADHRGAFVDHVLQSTSSSNNSSQRSSRMDPSLAGSSRNSELRVLQTDSLSLSALTTLREPPTKPWSLIRSIESWLVLRGGAKFLFWLSWVLFHLLVFGLGFVSYQLSDNRVNARSLFGTTYALSGATSLVLHIDVIFILFPVCRNLISFLRSRMSGLNTIIPFDQAVTFHEATGWSMIFFSLIHIVSHEINFMKLVLRDPLITNRNGHTSTSRLGAFFTLNFATGPGLTGWLMVLFLGIMTGYAMKRMRERRYERFWYSHHLFVLVFALWQLHGMFCLIKPDREPYCSWKNVGVFWRFWIAGGTIWIIERVLREIRSRHITYITKVILHPSSVVELRIKKQKTRYLGAGQHIYISCPEISYFQWHPFMITSSPEEDYLSVHVEVRGDWTSALAKAVGCELRGNELGIEGVNKVDEKTPEELKVIGGGRAEGGGVLVRTWTNTPGMPNKTLPRVMVDGPFGSGERSYLKYDTVLMVGVGMEVVPFASILKSVWYQMNSFNHNNLDRSTPTRLTKVYLFWVTPDISPLEWFHSLLQAIEEQDVTYKIEIDVYLTGRLTDSESESRSGSGSGSGKDSELRAHDNDNDDQVDQGTIATKAKLRTPTRYGKPDWDKVFGGLVERHSGTDVGVFHCGTQTSSKELRSLCDKWSDPLPSGTRFSYNKDNF